jgi:hypothetical protein
MAFSTIGGAVSELDDQGDGNDRVGNQDVVGRGEGNGKKQQHSACACFDFDFADFVFLEEFSVPALLAGLLKIACRLADAELVSLDNELRVGNQAVHTRSPGGLG